MTKIRENYESGDAITWIQVHNLLPILMIIISAVIGWQVLQKQVDLQSKDITNLRIDLERIEGEINTNIADDSRQAIDIATLLAKFPAVKGVSITKTDTWPATGSARKE
jgi:hypothetical protein